MNARLRTPSIDELDALMKRHHQYGMAVAERVGINHEKLKVTLLMGASDSKKILMMENGLRAALTPGHYRWRNFEAGSHDLPGFRANEPVATVEFLADETQIPLVTRKLIFAALRMQGAGMDQVKALPKTR